MLTVIEIGNTNIVFASYEDKWLDSLRVKTNDVDVKNQLKIAVEQYKSDKVVVSSVVPNITPFVLETVRNICKTEPLVINPNINTGLYRPSIPGEIGSDILCNLIAAHSKFPDKYVTVADFGTAFTTETVSPEGHVMGVTIGPGLFTSFKSLYQNTAQIPNINLDIPSTVLGRNTVDSVRAGVIFGFAGQLESIVKRIESEIGQKVVVIVTGGFSKYINEILSDVDLIDVGFTLEGARIAFCLNENK